MDVIDASEHARQWFALLLSILNHIFYKNCPLSPFKRK